ncbi:ABC transporter permease [Corynebacterium variabile]|uniref:ABC transporter permease n=1 Tax=Corynebacterium variabile TaxID=1727 RepID=UPI0028AC0272|nr:ABC transporter permease [Corynebacterium variabile]
MNLFSGMIDWLTDAGNWTGSSAIPDRLLQHIGVTLLVLVVAAVIALPVGLVIGHTRRGAGLIGAVTGALRAIPTLGLITLFGLALGIGLQAPVLAIIVLAIPSLLAGAYSGVQSINPALPQAARAIGMRPWQVVLTVELPLALPVIVGGIRAATLQVVATTTLAAYTSDTGLGRYIFAGLKSRDYPEMLGGSVLVIALALVLEVILAQCQRRSTRIADPGRTVSSTSATPR